MKSSRLVLLTLFFCLPILAEAQLYRSLEYAYDSTGNRTRRDSVGYIPQAVREPSRQLDTALQRIDPFPTFTPPTTDRVVVGKDIVIDSLRPRLVFTEEEKAAAYEKWVQESDSVRLHTLRSIRSIPDTTTYAFGEIPLQEGVSPSGARTYSIPIPTAPGFKFVPSVSLGYNSQTHEGWAGYGWDIQGISAISIINRCKYYHGEAKGANVTSDDPVFALDGVPLVTNTQPTTSADYPLITARGHILAAPFYDNVGGGILGFDVLFPNGVSARYGAGEESGCALVVYPVVLMTDLDGNRITFEYRDFDDDENYRLDVIRYGYISNNQYLGEISFTYSDVLDAPYRYYAGADRHYSFQLASIQSKNGNDVICQYDLTYKRSDNVPLLEQIVCTNDSTSLRPLHFEYGDLDYQPIPPDSRLYQGDWQLLLTAFSSDDVNYIYRRGKFVNNSYNDGLIVHPAFPIYDAIGWRKPLFGIWEYLFGSCYPSDQAILFYPTLNGYSTSDTSIITGNGFQTIEAVDVDGDGLDEIVKVNFNGTSGSNTKLLITVFKCNSSGIPAQTDQFEVQIQGTITSGIYTSPYYRTYRWGDFLGNGKIQLLAVAFDLNINSRSSNYVFAQTSYAALIDIASHSVLCDTQLFTLPRENSGSLLALDLDNDSQTELCFADENSLKVYRYHSQGGFVREYSFSGLTSSILSSTERPCYVTDLNGDGYVDILRSPEVGNSATWRRYAFTGSSFRSLPLFLASRADGDEFMFIDLNRDGCADLVKIGAAGLGIHMNIKGNHFGPYESQNSAITNTKGIIPANVIDWMGAGCFIKVDGHFVYEYQYEPLSPKLRQLTRVTDSRKRVRLNYYEYLPTHSFSYWNDTTFHVNNAAGYAFRTLPLYVLEEETAYQTEQFSPSSLFRDRRYCYFNGVVHSLGLGFCGFSKIRTWDYIGEGYADFIDEIHDPQKMGVVTAIEKRKGSTLRDAYSSVVNTYDNHFTTYGKLNPRLTQSVAADTLTHVNVTTAYTYDNYDFPLTENVSRRIGNGAAKTENKTCTYSHSVSTSQYVLGAVTQEEVLNEGDGDTGSSWREVTQISYDANFHPEMRSAFADTSLVSRTRWCYDAHGNVISEKTAPYNAEVFTGDTLIFDSAGRYLLSKTDALGHTTTYAGYNKFGKPASATDYRGRTTSFFYDDWGNLVRTVYPDSTVEQSVRAWGGDGLYTVTSTATGKPDRIVHYDALGREIKSGIKRFNGQWQWANKEYDKKGRIKRFSLPYRGAAPSYWNTYHYDYYDRPDTLREASGRLTTWSYSGTGTTTVIEGIASTKTLDANGNLVSATDPGGTITYALRDDGQPRTVTAPGGIQTSITYDRFGNRCQIEDPSAGVQRDTTVWNADGTSVRTHTNAKGSISAHMDRDGRTTLVERPEYNTTYTYDTHGRLTAEQSTNGTGTAYTYDALDRLSETVESVPDGKWLKKKYFYGSGSVLDSVLFVSQTDTVTTERYNYANGHLTGVTLSDGTVVWNLISENDLGKPTQITSGTINRGYGYTSFGFPSNRTIDDGDLQDFHYTFNPQRGNLSSRSDENYGMTESFYYDGLNRLYLCVTSPEDIFFEYWPNGSQYFRDDTGYTLYEDSSHPYRATGMSIEYPNLVKGRSQHISYTTYDRPSILDEGGRRAVFTYNGDYDRVRMQVIDTLTSSTLLSRYYIGGRYEIDLSGTTTKERFYLGGDAYSAPMVYVREGGTNGTWAAYNIGRDYLGSITHIATANGTLVAEYSYDPWGRLRNPETLAIYTANQEPNLFLGRGFTGQEHLPWFGLINMNARLYDPLLGRFLSPDPFVQAPDFTQSLNRYSYALNNPLKYTDESGEFWEYVIGALIGGLWNWIANGCSFSSNGFSSFAIGALAGIVGIWASGIVASSLGTIGFVSGSAIGAAGGGASGFVLGTINSWTQGDSFGEGLINGFKSSFAGALTGGLLGGLSAGVSSINNGGDFWTGEGVTFECFGGQSGYRVTVGDNMEYTNEYAKQFSDKNYGSDIKGLAQLHADGSIPNTGEYYRKGDMVYKIVDGRGYPTRGSCYYNGTGKGYDVYLYKGAFTSKEQLYLTMGHEYLHAGFNAMPVKIRFDFIEHYQHAQIYDWALKQSKVWDFNVKYYEQLYKRFSQYLFNNPYSYSNLGFYIIPIRPF